MEEKRKLELLEDMLELDAGSLSPQMELEEIDEWDSVAKLSLIVLMDDECGKKLTSDDIKAFVTVGDILKFMG